MLEHLTKLRFWQEIQSVETFISPGAYSKSEHHILHEPHSLNTIIEDVYATNSCNMKHCGIADFLYSQNIDNTKQESDSSGAHSQGN